MFDGDWSWYATYDVGFAQAMIEYIHEVIQAKTMFQRTIMVDRT